MTTLYEWLHVDLSSFYVETVKDRLYADASLSHSRLSAQTVLYHIFNHLIGILSPLTPILVEETWQHTPSKIRDHDTYPLHRLYPAVPQEWSCPSPKSPSKATQKTGARLQEDLAWLLAAKEAVNAAQEQARDVRLMGSPLESDVIISLPNPKAHALFARYATELEALFIVSGVQLINGSEVVEDGGSEKKTFKRAFRTLGSASKGRDDDDDDAGEEAQGTVYISVPPAKAKCTRCWRYVVSTPPPPPSSSLSSAVEAAPAASNAGEEQRESAAALLCERCKIVTGN